MAEPAGEALLKVPGLAAEAQGPVRVEAGRDQRRDAVGPVLEQKRLVLEQAAQQVRPVALAAGEQDHVVGAGDGLDAVELDEAQALDQRQKARAGEPPARRIGEAGEREGQAAGLSGRDRDRRHPAAASGSKRGFIVIRPRVGL